MSIKLPIPEISVQDFLTFDTDNINLVCEAIGCAPNDLKKPKIKKLISKFIEQLIYDQWIPELLYSASEEKYIEVWRALSFNSLHEERFLANLQSPEHNKLGVYWTWQEDYAQDYWGKGNLIYLLEGRVLIPNIDWKETTLRNISAGWINEKEIRIIENKEIQLFNIYHANKTVPFVQKKFFA